MQHFRKLVLHKKSKSSIGHAYGHTEKMTSKDPFGVYSRDLKNRNNLSKKKNCGIRFCNFYVCATGHSFVMQFFLLVDLRRRNLAYICVPFCPRWPLQKRPYRFTFSRYATFKKIFHAAKFWLQSLQCSIIHGTSETFVIS